MNVNHYIGFDVHKKSISYCAKTADGEIRDQGKVAATQQALSQWVARRPRPWQGAMEATLFTGWIYDFLKPQAVELEVGHPAMLRAIAAAKHSNDSLDAKRIADLLRAHRLPGCYMAPAGYRELRRVLRFRNLLVRQSVKLKNRMAGMLMETGVEYNKERLHHKKYFRELLGTLSETPPSVVGLLKWSRKAVEMFESSQRQLLAGLRRHGALKERVARLTTIPGVGEVTALTWALEVVEPERFASIRRAVSYCGLCSGQQSSAGVDYRGPLSKQRNKHLQSVRIEAAKLAPRWNAELKRVHERELTRGNRNRATLAVARKLVAYLLAVDRRGRPFAEGASPSSSESSLPQPPDAVKALR